MSQHYYIKLYFEILNDRKMCRLSDKSWRRIIELFLLAGSHKWSNYLPSVDDMAWELRVASDELLEDLREIEKTGIVKEIEPGVWIVTNFENRQDADTGAERTKRYRQRKRESIYSSDDMSDAMSQESVTSDARELRVKDIVKDRESQSDDEFHQMQVLIETLTGYPVNPNPENIKVINDFIKAGVIEDDIRGAIAFLGKNGKLARGPHALVGSVRTELAKRTQKANASKPYIPEDHASEVY